MMHTGSVAPRFNTGLPRLKIQAFYLLLHDSIKKLLTDITYYSNRVAAKGPQGHRVKQPPDRFNWNVAAATEIFSFFPGLPLNGAALTKVKSDYTTTSSCNSSNELNTQQINEL